MDEATRDYQRVQRWLQLFPLRYSQPDAGISQKSTARIQLKGQLPWFAARAEFAGYLDCSVMQRGFAHLACEDHGLPRLVAFTCAGRAFCPTCLGRRMNQPTHNLVKAAGC